MSKDDGVSEELKRIYRQAWCEGYWIQEFGAEMGYLAAAGSVKQLEQIEKQIGQEIDVSKLTLADVVIDAISSTPGNGSTREEACLNALKSYKEYEIENEIRKNEPYRFCFDVEGPGYNIDVYIPNSDQAPNEFVVRAYHGEELLEEIKIPLHYRLFPDGCFRIEAAEDAAALHREVEKLIQKLGGKG